MGKVISMVFLLVLAGCAAPKLDQPVTQNQRTDLTRDILALGPEIDPEEAARAARIALTYPRQLAMEYQITDPPLIHNAKVNAGIKPRGLCYDWADDLEARLKLENFKTLQLHRAIANATSILIGHSTVIVSQRGDTMFEGIVLDPWRYGGVLFWSPTLEDERYKWVDRQEVFREKIRRAKRRQS